MEQLGLVDMTILFEKGCQIVEVLGAFVAYHFGWALIASSPSLNAFFDASMILSAWKGRTTWDERKFRLT
jgi:hypothetical protein